MLDELAARTVTVAIMPRVSDARNVAFTHGATSSLTAMTAQNADLRSIVETLDPNARVAFRRVLIRDQADRDAICSRLMRFRDQSGGLGGHPRHADDASGGAADSGAVARRD